MPAPVRLGAALIGGARLALIAGPCVIETAGRTLALAGRLAEICRRRRIPLVFKASYDKANRTSLASYRGPGLERGLAILERVRRTTGLPVLSDVHTPEQAAAAGEVLDALQIPAFLCRQTDLLLAAGRTGRAVNIKKGQFLAPEDLAGAVAKVRATGNRRLLVTERGTCFGYHRLVVDFAGLPALRALGCPVVFDATHSVQLPSARGRDSGGESANVPLLARAAVAAGCDALFLEVHPHPRRAPSDSASMLALDLLPALLDRLLRIREAVRPASGKVKS